MCLQKRLRHNMYATLTVEFSANIPDIFLDISLNDTLITSNSFVKDTQQYTIEFDDTEEYITQCITVTMRGKTQQHTILDNDKIVSDVHAMIKRITIDEIDVTDLYAQGTACYHHVGSNNQQNGPVIIDEFYGYLGFNGDVKLEFTTPMWKWFNTKCS